MARVSVDSTVVATFTTTNNAHFASNWARHLRDVGVRGLIVGLMSVRPRSAPFTTIARQLREVGVEGVYACWSPEALVNPQGGRWFHLGQLLRTGARVLLSDSDVVWLRDPRPYLRRIEAAHPRLDLSVTTDAQHSTLVRPPQRGRQVGGHDPADRLAGGSSAEGRFQFGARPDLDLERFPACRESMNIGVMHFPPGRRRGSLAALAEVTAHLSAEGNLRRVDQGPINYRWKRGTGRWKWERPLHAVADRSGDRSGPRLCGLVNGSVVAGLLPLPQFGNSASPRSPHAAPPRRVAAVATAMRPPCDHLATALRPPCDRTHAHHTHTPRPPPAVLTHSLLRLDERAGVAAFAVHATWMRSQAEAFKLARLRESGLWRDPPSHYDAPALTYTPRLALELLAPSTLPSRGGLPLRHLRLVDEQLSQLRDALFIARLLRRALVLPPLSCSCELGFYPRHLPPSCRAHPLLPLPYNCSVDHVFDPAALAGSPFLTRERSYLAHPRAQRGGAVIVRVCGGNRSDADASRACTSDAAADAAADEAPRDVVLIRARSSAPALVTRLGRIGARVLHLDDVRGVLAGFGRWRPPDWGSATPPRPGAVSARWHREAQPSSPPGAARLTLASAASPERSRTCCRRSREGTLPNARSSTCGYSGRRARSVTSSRRRGTRARRRV